MTTKIKQTDGSNGYQAGTYEWSITVSFGTYCEGGHDTRAKAETAMRKRLRALRKDGTI